MNEQKVVGPRGTPLQILDRPIHDRAAMDRVSHGVGTKIKQQGGSKVLVICPDPEIINAFKRMNPQSARLIFPCNDAATIKKHPRAEVMCLGAFWAHRNWDAMYREIREKTSIAPHIRVHWFPF